jgi:hypothetical protein
MNLFLDVSSHSSWRLSCGLHIRKPELAALSPKTNLKLKVSQLLLSEYLPTGKQQMLLCP